MRRRLRRSEIEEETAHRHGARGGPGARHGQPGAGSRGPGTRSTVRAGQPVDLPCGRARLLHAGGIRSSRGGAHEKQERLEHHDEESDGHVGRGARIRTRRLRHRIRRWRAPRRMVRVRHRYRRRGADGGRRPPAGHVLLLPGGLRCDRGDHRLGRNGRAHEVRQLLRLQLLHHGGSADTARTANPGPFPDTRSRSSCSAQ